MSYPERRMETTGAQQTDLERQTAQPPATQADIDSLPSRRFPDRLAAPQ